jgi:hypothetical protein
MKTKIMLTGLGLVAIVSALLLGDGGSGASGAGEGGSLEHVPTLAPPTEKDVAKNPAMLISPTLRAGELSVYGVKLGASSDSIPGEAGVTANGVPERSQDTTYIGRSVRYYANDKKIYRITVMGDLVKQLPTYDAARLQMAMGKADESVESPADEDTRLSFFGRHVRYTVHAYRNLSLVTEVDLYAP